MRNQPGLSFAGLILLFVFAASTFTGLFPTPPAAARGRASQPRKSPIIVFALSGEGDDLSMDAVVIVEGKKLRHPFADEQEDAQKKFAEQYFATGRTYRLMFGGGEAGSVTLKKWSVGCNSVHAEVSAKTSARLGGQVQALATNSSSIGRREPSRRAPTAAERAQVRA